mgnify:CR=1 FL=1
MARGRYDAAARTYTLSLSQSNPAAAGQPAKLPQVIPVALGLLDAQERAASQSAELARSDRDLAAAEDALADAFAAALASWPVQGVPANPEAWVQRADEASPAIEACCPGYSQGAYHIRASRTGSASAPTSVRSTAASTRASSSDWSNWRVLRSNCRRSRSLRTSAICGKPGAALKNRLMLNPNQMNLSSRQNLKKTTKLHACEWHTKKRCKCKTLTNQKARQ